MAIELLCSCSASESTLTVAGGCGDVANGANDDGDACDTLKYICIFNHTIINGTNEKSRQNLPNTRVQRCVTLTN